MKAMIVLLAWGLVYYCVVMHSGVKMRGKDGYQSVGKQFNCGFQEDTSKVIKVYEALMCCKCSKIFE